MLVAGLVSNESVAAQSASAVDAQGSIVAAEPSGCRRQTCRIVQTASAVFTSLYGGVTIRGRFAASQLTLDTDDPTQFRELFSVSGAGTGLVDRRLVRARDLYTVMIDIKQSTG